MGWLDGQLEGHGHALDAAQTARHLLQPRGIVEGGFKTVLEVPVTDRTPDICDVVRCATVAHQVHGKGLKVSA